MSHDNVAAVREGYHAWAEEGIEAAVDRFLHAEVELHDLIEMPGGSVYRGHEGARRMWAQWTDVWQEFSFSLEDAEELDDDRVLTRIRARGRVKDSDAEFEVAFYEIWTLRDGLGVKRIAANDRRVLLEAARSDR